MSVATFTRPLPGTAVSDNLPRMIVGLQEITHKAGSASKTEAFLIVVDGDGLIGYLALSEVVVDWRYDIKSQTWNAEAPPDALGDDD